MHGWRPLYGNRYLWLIDSTLYHLQADGVQCGNSNNGNSTFSNAVNTGSR